MGLIAVSVPQDGVRGGSVQCVRDFAQNDEISDSGSSELGARSSTYTVGQRKAEPQGKNLSSSTKTTEESLTNPPIEHGPRPSRRGPELLRPHSFARSFPLSDIGCRAILLIIRALRSGNEVRGVRSALRIVQGYLAVTDPIDDSLLNH
jgi:hypothetical protein